MKLFLPVTILLSTTISAFFVPQSSHIRLRPWNSRSSLIMAAANDDRYSDLLAAYQKKKPALEDLAPPTLPEPVILPDPPVQDVVIQVPELPTIIDTPPPPPPLPQSPVMTLFNKPIMETPAIPSSGKAPTFLEFIQGKLNAVTSTTTSTSTPPSSNSEFDAFSNAKEKIEIIKQNAFLLKQNAETLSESTTKTISGDAVQEKLGFFKDTTESFWNTVKTTTAAVGTAATAASTVAGKGGETSGKNLLDLIEPFHFQEFGAWYVAALAIVVGFSQRQKGREDALQEYQAALAKAEAKAQEAAELASMAAQGAAMAKAMVTKQDTKPKKSTESLLESTKLQESELDKAMMKQKLETLTQETTDLKKQLQQTKSTISNTAASAAASVAPAQVKEVMPRDPDEDQRLLEIIREKDEQNMKLNKSKVAKKTTSTSTTTATVSKKATKKSKKAEPVAVEAVSTPEPVVVKEVPVPEPVVVKEVPIPAPVAPVPEPVAVPELFFSQVINDVEPAKPKSSSTPKGSKQHEAKSVPKGSKKVETTTSKVTKIAKKTVKVDVADESSPNPWSSLSLSTLKRKTVKDLTDYLSQRGVTVTDGEGNPLKKEELVSAVQKL